MQVFALILYLPLSQGLLDGTGRLCSFILLFFFLPLHETKLSPPDNVFLASLNLLAEKASG